MINTIKPLITILLHKLAKRAVAFYTFHSHEP